MNGLEQTENLLVKKRKKRKLVVVFSYFLRMATNAKTIITITSTIASAYTISMGAAGAGVGVTTGAGWAATPNPVSAYDE